MELLSPSLPAFLPSPFFPLPFLPLRPSLLTHTYMYTYMHIHNHSRSYTHTSVHTHTCPALFKVEVPPTILQIYCSLYKLFFLFCLLVTLTNCIDTFDRLFHSLGVLKWVFLVFNVFIMVRIVKYHFDCL